MSDIWTMDCDTCKGSGKVREHPNFITGSIKPPWEPCPTCKGAGGWWLGVRENETSRPHKPYYRPLTVEEVNQWAKEMASNLVSGQPWEHLMVTIKHIKEGYTVRYKDSPVKLIGRDNAPEY